MEKIIDADDKTVSELLAGGPYTVDDYQREYKWETKQVGDLVNDLFAAFSKNYKESHTPAKVVEYHGYFLGSVVVSERNIVDGQQRLTSLMLLLIALRHSLPTSPLSTPEREDLRGQLAGLIQFSRYSVRSFCIDAEERNECLNALYNFGEPEESHTRSKQESVRNLALRYNDIAGMLEAATEKEAELECFAHWLIENVRLVRIITSSQSDAYEVFETMNDRGLHLTQVDMLKNFLLSQIDDAERANVVKQWRLSLDPLVSTEEDADAIKSWLRARHAVSMRRRDKNAEARDFELIGSAFHRWVKDNCKKIGLVSAGDFASFIERDMAFYLGWYLKIRTAAGEFNPALECIYYNAENDFTLQYPVLLSALSPDDGEEVIMRKMRIVSRYLDILLYRRIMRRDKITRSTLEYNMNLLIKEIRGKSEEDLLKLLSKRLIDDRESAPDKNFGLSRNRRQVRRVLARITHYITSESEEKSHYEDYRPYDIEHIWANHYEQSESGCDNEDEFNELRDRLGGLLLLPRRVNRSLSDKPYSEKRELYQQRNLLAKSLHPKCYQNDPGFSRFRERSGLPFKPHAEFKKADLQERQELYLQIAGQIWNPDRLVE